MDYSLKKRVWDKLFEEFQAKMDFFKGNELITFAHAMALSGEGGEEEWRELQKRVNEGVNILKWESLSIWAFALAKSGKGREDSWRLIEKRLLTGNVDKLDFIASFCYSFSRSPLYGGGRPYLITSDDLPPTSNSTSLPPHPSSPFALSSSSLPPLWRRFERATISLSHQMSSRTAVYLSTSFAKISVTPSQIIFTVVENYVLNILEKERKEKSRCEEDVTKEEKIRNIVIGKEREKKGEEAEGVMKKEIDKEGERGIKDKVGEKKMNIGGKEEWRSGRRGERLEISDLALILWAFDKMKVGSDALWRLAAGKVKQEANKLNYEDCINLIYGFKGREMEDELSHVMVERLKTILLTWINEEQGNIRRKQERERQRKEEEMLSEEGSLRMEKLEQRDLGEKRESKGKKELFERMRVNSLKLIFVANPRGLEYWRDFGEITALSYLKSFEKTFRGSQAKLDDSYLNNYVDFLYISSFHGLSEDLRYCFGGMIRPVWERRHLFHIRTPDYINKLIFLVNKHKLAALPTHEIKTEMEKFLQMEGAIENLAFFLVNCRKYRNIKGEDWIEKVEQKVKEAVRGRKVFVDWVMGEEEKEVVEMLKELRKGEEVGAIVKFVLGN